jgi:hypothetical protein
MVTNVNISFTLPYYESLVLQLIDTPVKAPQRHMAAFSAAVETPDCGRAKRS